MGFFGDLYWRVLRLRLFDCLRPFIFHLDTYLLVGRTSWADHFSMLVLGSKVTVEYFLKLFYEGEVRVEALGRIVLGRIVSRAEDLGVDLVIVDSLWFFSKFLGDQGFFVSPRVDFVLKINETVEATLQHAARDKKRRLKQVAEVGYAFEVTKDPAKLKMFYSELYLPHMLNKHALQALPIGPSVINDLFSKGELLLTKSGNQIVSGSLLVPRGDELYSPVMGVSSIETQLTMGSYAAYYFSIIYGIQRGFSMMDFGEAPPFMSDGLFQFKKGLGMSVRLPLESGAQVFGVRFLGSGDCLRGFLSVFPFVFFDGTALSGLVFLNCFDVSSVKPFCIPGISSLYVISPTSVDNSLNDFELEKIDLRQHYSLSKPLSTFSLKESYFLYRVKLM